MTDVGSHQGASLILEPATSRGSVGTVSITTTGPTTITPSVAHAGATLPPLTVTNASAVLIEVATAIANSSSAAELTLEKESPALQKAICRTPEVPRSRVNGQWTIPVLAYHYDGIDYVQIETEGPDVSTGLTRTDQVMVASRSTFTGYKNKLWCYSAAPDFSVYKDGAVTVRISAVPRYADTVNLTRQIEYVALNNSGSTLPSYTLYVSPETGDNGNAGTDPGEPLQSIGAAKGILANGTHSGGPYNGTKLSNGATIYLMEGGYGGDVGSGYPYVETPDEWLTFAVAPGHNPYGVAFSPGAGPRNHNVRSATMVRCKDLVFNDYAWGNSSGQSGDSIWFDGCVMAGSGPTDDYRGIQTGDFEKLYFTGCDVSDTRNPFVSVELIRDTVAHNIGEDAIKGFGCIVNSTCHNIRKAHTSYHPDGIQLTLENVENRVACGFRLFDAVGVQALYHDKSDGGNNSNAYTDVAYENCLFGYVSDDTNTLLSQWFRSHVHCLLIHCTFIGQDFKLRTDESNDEAFSASKCKAINVAFHRMDVGSLTNNGDFRFFGCHHDQAPVGAWVPGTVGQTVFNDEPAFDYRGGNGSPLLLAGESQDACLGDLPPGPEGAYWGATGGFFTSLPTIGAWGDAAGSGFKGGTYTVGAFTELVTANARGGAQALAVTQTSPGTITMETANARSTAGQPLLQAIPPKQVALSAATSRGGAQALTLAPATAVQVILAPAVARGSAGALSLSGVAPQTITMVEALSRGSVGTVALSGAAPQRIDIEPAAARSHAEPVTVAPISGPTIILGTAVARSNATDGMTLAFQPPTLVSIESAFGRATASALVAYDEDIALTTAHAHSVALPLEAASTGKVEFWEWLSNQVRTVAHKELRAVLNDIPIYYDNQIVRRQRGEHILMRISYVSTTQTTLGPRGSRLHRTRGAAIFQVRVPMHVGDGRAFEIADWVRLIFRQIKIPTVHFYVADPRPVGRIRNFYQLNVRVPFWADHREE